MSNMFPSLPAPRFAPQKPSPLGPQSGQSIPPESLKNDPPKPTHAALLASAPNPPKQKKKRPAPPLEAESSGPGRQFATQVYKLVDALKTNGGPMNLSDLEALTGVRGLLSEHTDIPFNKQLYQAFNDHERVTVTERGSLKLWSYRPDFLINSSEQLLELLRKLGGLPIASLKQSRPNVMSAITELENEGKVLVFRTEGVAGKEGTARTVFYDTLGCRNSLGPGRGALDEEFREMWHSLETPPAHSLPLELQEAGLTASTSAAVKPVAAQKRSKKRSKGGKVKITNTHLKDLGIDLSKDYIPDSNRNGRKF